MRSEVPRVPGEWSERSCASGTRPGKPERRDLTQRKTQHIVTRSAHRFLRWVPALAPASPSLRPGHECTVPSLQPGPASLTPRQESGHPVIEL